MNFLNLEAALEQLKCPNEVGDRWIEPLELWINTVVRNHLLRGDSFPGVRWEPVVTEREYQLIQFVQNNPSAHPIDPRTAPEWLLKCIRDGVAVDYLIVTPDIARRQLSHLEDFFKDVLAGRSQFNMAVQDAIEASEKWIKQINRKTKMEIGEVEEIDVDDEFKLVRLIDKQSYAYEGRTMEHCVKNYFGKQGSTVYSVRDLNDVSKATVEVRDDMIVQFNGPNNTSPSSDVNTYGTKALEAIGITARKNYGVAPMYPGSQTIEVSMLRDVNLEVNNYMERHGREIVATITAVMSEEQARALQHQMMTGGQRPNDGLGLNREDYMGYLRRPEFQR